MKSKILFALLLSAIIALGLLGTPLLSRVLSAGDSRNIIVEKAGARDDAMYISSSEGISFSPMSIVDKDSAVPVDSAGENNGVLSFSQLLETYTRFLCAQSDKTAFDKPVGPSLASTFMLDWQDYIYSEDFHYLNPAGEERQLDIIIDSYDMSIVYICFSDGSNYELTGKEVESGINKLKKYTDAVSTCVMPYDVLHGREIPSLSDTEGIEIPEFDEYIYVKSDEFSSPSYLSETLLWVMSEVTDQYQTLQTGTNCPLTDFLCYMSGTATIIYTSEYGEDYDPYLDTFSPIYQEMLFPGAIPVISYFMEQSYDENTAHTSTEYASHNGRIYQRSKNIFGELTLIFNVKTNSMEGFFFNRTDR
ncbi:MAG: hypothetical protein IJM55_03345 [Ruminococcus sp.]|nr:hypothetical protein [Ruminococcus sp.]